MTCLRKMFSRCILRFNKVNTLTVTLSKLHIQRPPSVPISGLLPVSGNTSHIYKPLLRHQNEIINLPTNNNLNLNFELPNGLKTILPIIEPKQEDVKEAPALDDSIKKEAVKMIVIRRKKMKKHKLKKLRKRMKFEWAKKRQRRELKKEKMFQAQLIQQYTKAEEFSAEQYVQEKINKYNEAMVIISENSNVTTSSDANK